MQGVCNHWHGKQKIEGFYKQFNTLMVKYNSKSAKMLYEQAEKDLDVNDSVIVTPPEKKTEEQLPD